MKVFILVTGGTTHLGSHIIKQLLARGTHVRAAVESESAARPLGRYFESDVASGALTFAYVADMLADGALDEAVKEVTGVIHAAFPLPESWEGDVRTTMIDPAAKGVTSILRSAAKEPSIKSFVLTGSAAAYSNLDGPNKKQVTDASWNPLTLEQVASSDSPLVTYAASHLFAEKAAWQLIEELQPSFRFASLGVVLVAGPTLLDSHNVTQESNGFIWSFANGDVYARGDELAPLPFVHITDAATAHLRALDEPRADRKRFLLCGNDAVISARDVAKMARCLYAGLNNVEEPENTREHECYEVFVTSNSKDILGMQYSGVDAIVIDVVEQGLEQRKARLIP